MGPESGARKMVVGRSNECEQDSDAVLLHVILVLMSGSEHGECRDRDHNLRSH